MKEKEPKSPAMDLPKNDYDVTLTLFGSRNKRDVEIYMEKLNEDNNSYASGIVFSFREQQVVEEDIDERKVVTYYIVMATMRDSDDVVDNANNRLDCMVRLVNYLVEKITMG